MASHSPLANRVAALHRHRAADDPELLAARRELRAANLAQHVQRIVDQTPPLTDAERERVAAILRPSPVATRRQPA